MALRLRESGTLVCAAQSEPHGGDIYIDDRNHYDLVQHEAIWTNLEMGKYWEFRDIDELISTGR